MRTARRLAPRLPRLPRLRVPPQRDPDRFSLQDLVVEAGVGLGARPVRLVTTTLGTVIGIASLVVTVGFAETTAGQIARQFDEVEATRVLVEPREVPGPGGVAVPAAILPWDAGARVARLAGVESAGVVADVALDGRRVTTLPVVDPAAAATFSPEVVAADADALGVLGARVVTGRVFDRGHDERADRVAVLGAAAAQRLGVNRVDSRPSVFVGDVPYAVVGIVDGLTRRTDLLDVVVVPVGTARADLGLAAPGELHARIALGAGPVVAAQAPVALDPQAPDGFDVRAPAAASALEGDVRADVNGVFLVLGLLTLVGGGLGIANVTQLSVSERTGEIGLRRALGATGRVIAAQVALESAVTGLLGGLVGSALGVGALVAVSAARQWTPVVDVRLALGAALLGAVVGLVAGIPPSLRAARIEPAAALRGGV